MIAPFAQTPAQPPVFISLLPMVVLFALFYFMLIRPQQKQRREHDAMLKALKKNDAVVTIGGVHGTILNVKDNTLTVRIDDNVKVELDRSAIARVASPAGA